MSGRTSALLVVLMFAVDRWTKQLVTAAWELGESLPVVPSFFSLTYVRNRGGAFGMLGDLPDPWRVPAFVLFATATVAALLWMMRETPREDVAQRLALTAVIGGAAGNLWDRVTEGEVVDFLDVYVGDWHWPAFNLADTFITCGVLLLLWTALRPAAREQA